MRKLLLLFLAVPCFAGGPKYVGTNADADVFQEFGNVYHDIANPTINVGTASSMTITSLTVSTITAVSSATIRNLATAGLVKQVVFASGTSNTAVTGATLTTTVVTASISPTATTSKVIVTMCFTPTTANGTNSGVLFTIKNGTTNLAGGTQAMGFMDVAVAGRLTASQTVQWVDSPGSTSSQTYTLFIANQDGTTTISCNNSGTWSVKLEEISQ